MATVAQVPVRPPATKRAVRRRLRFTGQTESTAQYGILSRTRPDVRHETLVDLATGQVSCSCEHFQYRCTRARLGHEPTVADAEKLCHHCQRAINEALRHERFGGDGDD